MQKKAENEALEEATLQVESDIKQKEQQEKENKSK